MDRDPRRKTTKKPSQIRRDRQRRERFLENCRQAATTVEVTRNEVREEVQEENRTVNNSADESRTVIDTEAARDNSVRAGASEEKNDQENVDEEMIIQIDGNLTLSDIVKEEEKTEQPETRSYGIISILPFII